MQIHVTQLHHTAHVYLHELEAQLQKRLESNYPYAVLTHPYFLQTHLLIRLHLRRHAELGLVLHYVQTLAPLFRQQLASHLALLIVYRRSVSLHESDVQTQPVTNSVKQSLLVRVNVHLHYLRHAAPCRAFA